MYECVCTRYGLKGRECYGNTGLYAMYHQCRVQKTNLMFRMLKLLQVYAHAVTCPKKHTIMYTTQPMVSPLPW